MASATCTVTAADGTTFIVIEGLIHLPRMGVWHADLTLDAPGATDAMKVLSGRAVVNLAGTTFSGSFGRNSATQRDTIRARILAGGGGFATQIQPKGYRATTLKIVIGDILNAAGETLSATADPAVLATNLPHWIAVAQPAGLALQSALRVTGATWRMLPDGTVWFGTETYPVATMDDFVQMGEQPELGRFEFSSYTPTLLPGTTFQGQPISAVVHAIQPESLRSTLFVE